MNNDFAVRMDLKTMEIPEICLLRLYLFKYMQNLSHFPLYLFKLWALLAWRSHIIVQTHDFSEVGREHSILCIENCDLPH